MELMIEPQIGVPLPEHEPYTDLRRRLDAMFDTVEYLYEQGLPLVQPTDIDKDVAATLAHAYAQDPEGASKKVTDSRASELRPAAIILASNIIKDFNYHVVSSSVQIRNLVTNKLILETENADPRIRIRAMELLGKISDVGLFAEKHDLTVTHQTSDELKQKLKSQLQALLEKKKQKELPAWSDEVADDAHYEVIDVESELGE